jgi:hypothetical protein
MSRPSLLNNAIRLVAALALLVSVMASPIRPLRASSRTGTAHRDYLRPDLGIPGKAGTNHRPHVPITSRVVQVKAISSESEHESCWTTDPVCHGVDQVFRSLHQPERDPAPLAISRASHPLRC